MDEPRCGKCGEVMTPADSKIRPELFLHDRCLPDELKPKAPPKEPGTVRDYLGDAVYAAWNGHTLTLTTEHHEPAKAGNVIQLDRDVARSLLRFLWRTGDFDRT